MALQYLLHDGIARAFDQGLTTGTFTLTAAAIGHMAGGGAVLLLVFWRLALRQQDGTPPPPDGEPPWQKMAARLVHGGIYVVLLLLPVSGAVAWGNGSAAAGDVHEALRGVLLLLIGLHVLAALYGQFVQKSGVIDRMR